MKSGKVIVDNKYKYRCSPLYLMFKIIPSLGTPKNSFPRAMVKVSTITYLLRVSTNYS